MDLSSLKRTSIHILLHDSTTLSLPARQWIVTSALGVVSDTVSLQMLSDRKCFAYDNFSFWLWSFMCL